MLCENTCEMTEGPKFTAGCYRTVVSADFNSAGSATSGVMSTFRLYPRQNPGLKNVFLTTTSDGRLRFDPRACTYVTMFYAEDNPSWLDPTNTQQVVTVESTMQMEYGYGGITFRLTDETTNMRLQYTQYSTSYWYLYLIMQVAGRWTYLGQLTSFQRDLPPIYIPQRIADARFNGRNNLTFTEFFDDAKT